MGQGNGLLIQKFINQSKTDIWKLLVKTNSHQSKVPILKKGNFLGTLTGVTVWAETSCKKEGEEEVTPFETLCVNMVY